MEPAIPDLRTAPRADAYAQLLAMQELLLEGSDDPIAAMATISALLHHAFTHLWTGFYRVVVPEQRLRVGLVPTELADFAAVGLFAPVPAEVEAMVLVDPHSPFMKAVVAEKLTVVQDFAESTLLDDEQPNSVRAGAMMIVKLDRGQLAATRAYLDAKAKYGGRDVVPPESAVWACRVAQPSSVRPAPRFTAATSASRPLIVAGSFNRNRKAWAFSPGHAKR